MTASPLALAAESLAGITPQTLGVGLLRAVQRNRPLVRTCRRGLRIRGIAPARTRRLPIDPDARARRNLVGRLSETRVAGQQGQDSSDRKDSADFHCNDSLVLDFPASPQVRNGSGLSLAAQPLADTSGLSEFFSPADRISGLEVGLVDLTVTGRAHRAEREAASAGLKSSVEHGIVTTVRGPAGRRFKFTEKRAYWTACGFACLWRLERWACVGLVGWCQREPGGWRWTPTAAPGGIGGV